MNLNNILKKISAKLINYKDLISNDGIIEQFNTNTGNNYYLNFDIPNQINEDVAKQIIDNLRNKLDMDTGDIQLLFNNGGVSLADMNKNLETILTKRSCRNEEDKCNISYEPYNIFDFDTINPSSNPRRKYTSKEISDKKSKFEEKCKTDGGVEKKKLL